MTELVLLVGPTASGKSAVAYELARRCAGEIISADSMQVYRGMPILTQQPPAAWQRDIPHHLIGSLDLSVPWSAADFRREALALIEAVRSRGHLPIIVGGTGLYIRALIDGLCEAPAAQPEVRARLCAEIDAQGSNAAHQRLSTVDPVAAGNIHPRDVRRIVRALEVFEVTRRPLSQHWAAQPRQTLPYQCALIGLTDARAALYDRINARVMQMFRDGVVEEVRALAGRTLSHTAQQMLGLTLIREHLGGRRPLDETIQHLQQQTRQYARRQLIWFKKDARIRWVTCDGRASDDITAQCLA